MWPHVPSLVSCCQCTRPTEKVLPSIKDTMNEKQSSYNYQSTLAGMTCSKYSMSISRLANVIIPIVAGWLLKQTVCNLTIKLFEQQGEELPVLSQAGTLSRISEAK